MLPLRGARGSIPGWGVKVPHKKKIEMSTLLFLLCVCVCFVALGLCCSVRAFSGRCECGLLLIVVCGFLLAVASLVAHAGSVAVVHDLSRSEARGISPYQGLNLCPLHWQADSYVQRHHPFCDF